MPQNLTPAVQHHKFEALDGMRGVLAVLIAVFHFPMLTHFYDSNPLRYAYLAVDFFFVLSGFVISHASLPQLTSLKNGGVFILRRFGRVYPLHVFVLGCFIANECVKFFTTHNTGITGKFAAFAGDNTYSLASIPTNLLLIQSLNIHDKTTWNGPAWSISTEFYTYILFAVLAIFGRRLLTPLAIAAIALCIVLLLQWVPTMNTTYNYGFLRCVAGFFTGYLTYKMWQARSQPIAYPTITELIALILVVTFAMAAGNNQISMFIPFIFALTVYIFAHQQGAVSRLLQTHAFQAIGLLSYSLYITHSFLLVCIKRLIYTIEKTAHVSLQTEYTSYGETTSHSVFVVGNPWEMDLMAVIFIITAIATAALATRFIETPGRTYFNTLAKKWQNHKPAKTV